MLFRKEAMPSKGKEREAHEIETGQKSEFGGGKKMGENICIIAVPNRRKMNLDNKRTRWWLGRKGAGGERWKVGKQLTTTESQNGRERQMERTEGSKRGRGWS